ncbi:ABC transporter ATP-binding protein [Ruegeria sp. R13_0]|uniref:ABC transporter ATP-binding protein n=1 Tax=Ruegeria sp. R13_0 TaxID=2821099 RepID=UPI001ADD5A45|nr:ABC transporter ATP-binding protein [Ruegeria sp. R13_0]MBO9436770.1 ABC transporter ATP-binding protein [Ruegeria sp. R13_0]
MFGIYKKIMDLFDHRERRAFYLIMGLMVLVAFAEVLGISAVLMLLNVLAIPEKIQTNNVLSWVYDFGGFSTTYAFLVFLSIAVLLVVVVGLLIKAGGTYLIIRFSTMRGYKISCQLLQSYLHRPYAWFLENNSASIRKSVLNDVDLLVGLIITPSMRVLANVILGLSIISFLIYVEPVLSSVAILLMSGSYVGIYINIRNVLRVLGQKILKTNEERFKLAQEATDGFKEVKLMGLEDSYISRFQNSALRQANYSARNEILRALPRFFLEAITIGILLACVLLLLLRSSGNLVEIIPTLGIFFFSVMRFLPVAQQIYQNLAAIRTGSSILEHIHAECVNAGQQVEHLSAEIAEPGDCLSLDRSLEIRNLSFSYATAEQPALHGIDLNIRACNTIGIVGGSGAGKTTLVDIVLGLLKPKTGEIVADGTVITASNLRRWQQLLGYVPQSIYLTDDTIARNIAFAVPPEEIDMAAVKRAARIAALHDFILDELPQGYDTFVGERGVRLSGGQRQRIGIARALYSDPSLLILDEATSALDNITESVVMEAVQRIRADKTIIIIAHRLSTVRNCDTIYFFEQGQIASSGTYDELVAKNATFRKMAVNT